MTRLAAYTGTKRAAATDRSVERPLVRISVIAVVIVAFFSVLVVRLWTLQVIDGSTLFSVAQGLTTRTITQPAPRGLICARDGCLTAGATCNPTNQVLASDQTYNVATLTRAEYVNNPAIIPKLAEVLSVSNRDLSAILSNESEQYSPSAPLPVAGIPPLLPAVTPEVIAEIAEHESEFPGVSFSDTTERCYPYGTLASQAVGYVGAITASPAFQGLNAQQEQIESARYQQMGYSMQDNQFGLSGLEATYEPFLHGTAGSETVEVNPLSIPVGGAIATKAAVPGDNVILNMDLGLQKTTTTALTNEMNALHRGANQDAGVNADWAAAVVLDVHSGAVLAMDSYPNYNANVWVPSISQSNYQTLLDSKGEPLNNYAITGLQAPGSTFKLATATAALNDGLITPYSTIDDTGTYTIGTTTLHDADAGAMGYVNVSTALARSSDVFFYTLGGWFSEDTAKYGQTPIQNVANSYGIGVSSGIDLPGASNGQVDSQHLRVQQHAENPSAFPYTSWYPGDNVEMAFGQGETLATPIEMAGAYATFANGGTRYAPEMAAGIVSSSGKLVKRIAPKVESHVSVPTGANYQAIMSGFEGAVQNPLGTAYADFTGFNFSKWNIAGKTGTATSSPADQISPTAWFVAFGGPKNESPQYVVAVEIDRAGYGADAAAPVARQIFNYLYAHPLSPAHL